jgi:hypothetical protein
MPACETAFRTAMIGMEDLARRRGEEALALKCSGSVGLPAICTLRRQSCSLPKTPLEEGSMPVSRLVREGLQRA